MISPPRKPEISLRVPPNYSHWHDIELSYQCAKLMIDKGIPGDFVECGVATGNNLAAMCLAGRHGYGFDSFQGIPWAGPHDDVQPGLESKDKSKEGILESSGVTVHSIEDCHENMKKFGITNYTLIEGWFQDTVPKFDEIISVLRLDGDLYESTLVCISGLYPLLSDGGVLIVDDWNLSGCRKAVTNYLHSWNHRPTKIYYNGGPMYFQK